MDLDLRMPLAAAFVGHTGAVVSLLWILNAFRSLETGGDPNDFSQIERREAYQHEGMSNIIKQSLKFYYKTVDLESQLDNYLEEYDYKSSWPGLKLAMEDFRYKVRWQLDHKISNYLFLSKNGFYEKTEFYPMVNGLFYDLAKYRPSLVKRRDDFVGRWLNQTVKLSNKFAKFDKTVKNGFERLMITLNQRGRFLLSYTSEKKDPKKFQVKDLELLHTLFLELDHLEEVQKPYYYKNLLRYWMPIASNLLNGKYYDTTEESKMFLRIKYIEIPSAISSHKESLIQYTACLTETAERINEKWRTALLSWNQTRHELIFAIKSEDTVSNQADEVIQYFRN